MIFSNYHTESETGHRQVYKPLKQLFIILVGGFNPSEKYESKWESSPNRSENKKCLKPPASIPFPPWKILSCHVPEFCTAAQPNIVQQTWGPPSRSQLDDIFGTSSGNFRDPILNKVTLSARKDDNFERCGSRDFQSNFQIHFYLLFLLSIKLQIFAPDSFT